MKCVLIEGKLTEVSDDYVPVPESVAPSAPPVPPRYALPDFRPYFSRPDVSKGYFPMESDDYHRFPAVNAGLLKHATPAEMLHSLMDDAPQGEPGEVESVEEQKEALTLGTLTHAIILEPWKFQPEHFDKYFVRFTETKGLNTKAAKEAILSNPGKLLVTPKLIETAYRIRAEAFDTNEYAQELLKSPDGMIESSGLAWDPANEIMRKIRPDYLPRKGKAFGDYILDIKTTRKPLHQFPKECWTMGYFTQAAWYLDTHELITGHRPHSFVWLVVTNKAPFMSRLFFMQNRDRHDPLWKHSTIKPARETLGLEPSAAIGRLGMFKAAALDTIGAGDTELNPLNVRRLWAGYEGESPMFEIL